MMQSKPIDRFIRAMLALTVSVALAGCALPPQSTDRNPHATTTAASDGPVFTSTTYGLRLPYPAGPILRKQPDPAYLLSARWKLYADTDENPGQPLVALTLPDSNAVTTAELRVGVSRDPASLRSCRQTPAAVVPDSIGTTRIDGVTFTMFKARDAGMSHYMIVHAYRAVHDATCYALDVVVYGTNPRVYDPPRTPPFSPEQAFARLTPVVTGLTFVTGNTTAQ